MLLNRFIYCNDCFLLFVFFILYLILFFIYKMYNNHIGIDWFKYIQIKKNKMGEKPQTIPTNRDIEWNGDMETFI